ncbi:PREDICTED: ankyrin repeat and LEM domain-containing protein 2 [Cyphomyrmex costatus]|uniref:Ankyrin repeat and LEM domain-containing protein 2 n=1 Tax=Cyphomyrmex costatus TaxID=456900 RepID=A0A151IHN1_9HYME|nr:PREDICTED: ankyrin repeat and LEM domain-containing protein 2 [Cyphomyrmex costatus]KYN01665.1 Ankyrin repeat and LEM domain-containing protein 2 [Cyphomyrmex costatus]
MTPASREFVVNLLNVKAEDKTIKTNEGENVCDVQPNLPIESLYHAVYIPLEYRDQSDGEETLHVYLEMQAALKVINTYKKGRLKSFKNSFDAVTYARTGYKQSSSNHPVTATVQESSNLKAPTTQELIAFKRLIENGDVKTVKNIVWENPGYLISSGDTPAILQMGFRYNALHIAAKKDKPKMCEFLLNTVGDPKFMQRHYGEDKCKTYLNLEQIIQDLYLNTPDKGLNETPLHFAVKFGCKDVVRVLVSYSQCIKTLKNKYQQMPKDIICSRKKEEDEALKCEIRMLLEDQFYVPVLRTEGNTCPPIIGEPFSPNDPLKLNKDPISPHVEVRAFAGPMTKTQAVEFRKKWKTPPRVTPKKGQGDAPGILNSPSIALKLQDTEKGLERVGRDLAEECQVLWKEYWPFLKDFVDFRSDDGLTKLERYLEQRFKNKRELFYSTRNVINNIYTPANCEDEPISCQHSPRKVDVNDIQYVCDKLYTCSLTTEIDNIEENTDSLEFFTPPSSPEPVQDDSDDDMLDAEEGSLIFIEGSSPTKLDYAVYNALSSMICSDTYPYVYHWRHDMQLAMKRDPYRFNKTSLRKKLFTNN